MTQEHPGECGQGGYGCQLLGVTGANQKQQGDGDSAAAARWKGARQDDDGQRLECHHQGVLPKQGANMIDKIGGEECQARKQRDPYVSLAIAIDGESNCDSADERSEEAQQPAVPVGGSEDPDEGRGQHVIERRVIAGVERKGFHIAIGQLALAEEHRVMQLETLALIIVEGKGNQVGGVEQIDQKRKRERQSCCRHQSGKGALQAGRHRRLSGNIAQRDQRQPDD